MSEFEKSQVIQSHPILFLIDQLRLSFKQTHITDFEKGSEANEFFTNNLILVNALYRKRKQMGVLLLYYFNLDQNTLLWNLYEAIVGVSDQIMIDQLQIDLKRLGERMPVVFIEVLPMLYKNKKSVLGKMLMNNHQTFQTVVQTLYPKIWYKLQNMILQGKVVLINKDNVKEILNASLEYESWEQYVTWKLLISHMQKKVVSYDDFNSCIPKIKSDADEHAEALSALSEVLVTSMQVTIGTVGRVEKCGCFFIEVAKNAFRDGGPKAVLRSPQKQANFRLFVLNTADFMAPYNKSFIPSLSRTINHRLCTQTQHAGTTHSLFLPCPLHHSTTHSY